MADHEVTIRAAGPELAGSVYALLLDCGRDMAARGFRNWDPPPATPESIEAETRAQTVLVALTGAGVVVGTATLRREPTHSYEEDERAGRVAWAAAGAAALYLNRLAVAPQGQRSGLGAALLRAAEAEARARAAAALRCDVLADNPDLVEWYRRRGYLPRGRRAHGGKDFLVLEKPLT